MKRYAHASQPRWRNVRTWTTEWLLWVIPATREFADDLGTHYSFVVCFLYALFLTTVSAALICLLFTPIPIEIGIGLAAAIYLVLGLVWMFRPYR